MRKALVSGTTQGMSSDLAKALGEADITSITGSKSIGKELGEQLVDAAVGKKPRRYKKTTKGKTRVKTPVDTQKITTEARKTGTKAALTAKQLDMKIFWRGKGIKEKGYNEDGKVIIECDKSYFRPLDVNTLLGDSRKARKKLKWKPKVNIDMLIKEMIKAEQDQINEPK